MLLSLLVQLLTQDDLIQLPNKTTLLTRYTGDDHFTGDEFIPGYYKSKLFFTTIRWVFVLRLSTTTSLVNQEA
jgi:hypothetical protein